MNANATLDELLRATLVEFDDWLRKSDWYGKERDCVNLFAHQFLARCVGPGGAIEHLAQIGIEVPVPQPVGVGIKLSVNRDLVIWDCPGQVTWNRQWRAVRPPRAILEWKARRKGCFVGPILDETDREWLAAFVRQFPECLAYQVSVDFTERRVVWEPIRLA